MAGYTRPVFRDHDPRYPVTAEKLNDLGRQLEAAALEADDPSTPLGAAVARAVAAGGGGGFGVRDNNDGTLTLTNDATFTDNGDGTLTIGA